MRTDAAVKAVDAAIQTEYDKLLRYKNHGITLSLNPYASFTFNNTKYGSMFNDLLMVAKRAAKKEKLETGTARDGDEEVTFEKAPFKTTDKENKIQQDKMQRYITAMLNTAGLDNVKVRVDYKQEQVFIGYDNQAFSYPFRKINSRWLDAVITTLTGRTQYSNTSDPFRDDYVGQG